MNFKLIKNLCRIGAVAGIFGTAYFSAKNGEKICHVCKKVNDESYGMTASWKVKHYIRNTPRLIKPLGPTIACAAGSVVCMAVSERINYKQIAALTATCVYLTKNRDFLEKKLEELVGKEKIDEIKQEFFKKNNTVFTGIQKTGGGDELWMDGYYGTLFYSSKQAVEEGIEAFNHLICPEAGPEDLQLPWEKVRKNTQYACMNDLYSILNLEPILAGDDQGYTTYEGYTEGPITFDFYDIEDFRGSGMTCHVFIPSYFHHPYEGWQEV